MNILFLTTIILSKNCNGGEVASQCFIDALKSLGHQVQVVGYLRKGDIVSNHQQGTIIVDERYTETKKSLLYALSWLVFGFSKGLPYSSAKYFSYAYIKLIEKLLSSYKYDIIIVDHAQLAWVINYLPKTSKIVSIAHNVEHQMYEELARKTSNFILRFIYKREANLIRLQEEKIGALVEQVWTLTEHDGKYFSKITGFARTKTFGIAPSSTKPQNQLVLKSFDVGILGSWSWKANIEALEWFLKKVYPHLPVNLSIHVAGKGADWLRDKYPNIYYRGIVPDAQRFMAEAKVVIIPTQSGGGIQIKTLDAIASGSKIIATPISLRGISQPPPTVKLATDPELFADLIISAVSLKNAENLTEQAKKWYQIRQIQFCNNVTSSIDELLAVSNYR